MQGPCWLRDSQKTVTVNMEGFFFGLLLVASTVLASPLSFENSTEVTTTVQPAPAVQLFPGCGPPGVHFPWKEFNGNCYLFVKTAATWDEARTKCSNHLADLVSIGSEEEQNFLSGIVNSTSPELVEESYWVGGKRECDDCEGFIWTDGTPWVFQDFDEETVNIMELTAKVNSTVTSPKAGIQGNCVQAGPRWKEASCEEKKFYFCEY